MKSPSIKTKKGTLTLIEKGIIKFVLRENVEWDLEDAKETHRANLQLSNGEKFCVYHIANKFFIPSKEAQAFIAKKECTDYRIAAAFIVNSAGMRLMANLFVKFFNSKSHSRVFGNEDTALKWLRSEYKKGIQE